MAKLFLGASRLREERERLGKSQSAFGAFADVTENSVANWENGRASPNAAALIEFAGAGADVLYILTGRRERAVPELTDRERLEVAIEAVEEGLAAAVREIDLSPARKAELILAAYDLIAEQEPEEARPHIIRLVRAA